MEDNAINRSNWSPREKEHFESHQELMKAFNANELKKWSDNNPEDFQKGIIYNDYLNFLKKNQDLKSQEKPRMTFQQFYDIVKPNRVYPKELFDRKYTEAYNEWVDSKDDGNEEQWIKNNLKKYKLAKIYSDYLDFLEKEKVKYPEGEYTFWKFFQRYDKLIKEPQPRKKSPLENEYHMAYKEYKRASYNGTHQKVKEENPEKFEKYRIYRNFLGKNNINRKEGKPEITFDEYLKSLNNLRKKSPLEIEYNKAYTEYVKSKRNKTLQKFKGENPEKYKKGKKYQSFLGVNYYNRRTGKPEITFDEYFKSLDKHKDSPLENEYFEVYHEYLKNEYHGTLQKFKGENPEKFEKYKIYRNFLSRNYYNGRKGKPEITFDEYLKSLKEHNFSYSYILEYYLSQML